MRISGLGGARPGPVRASGFRSISAPPKTLRALQINFAEQNVIADGRTPGFGQRYLLQYSANGKSWSTLADKQTNTQDVPHDYLELIRPVTARYLKLTDAGTPGGGKFSVRGLRIFGHGAGAPPAAISRLAVQRDASSRRVATLTWPAVPGSDGAIIRYGVAPRCAVEPVRSARGDPPDDSLAQRHAGLLVCHRFLQ